MDEQRPAAPQLTALDPRQKWVLFLRALIMGFVPFAGIAIGDSALSQQPFWTYGVATAIVGTIYLALVMIMPGRRWRRWGYHMGDDALRIASGLVVRRETIVPFARVQHIDVSRGPIERGFGVATLTLHTAGSFNSTVALPGLALETAEAMREEIRGHIRHDLL